MATVNMHATAVLLGDRGVLVAGPSGAGKTALALSLIDKMRSAGRFSRLVSDDQVFLSAHGERLLCHAPRTIAGLAEIRGLGPCPVDHEGAAVVDLLVRLAPESEVLRFAEAESELVLGCSVARLVLAEREIVAAVPAIFARLGLGLSA